MSGPTHLAAIMEQKQEEILKDWLALQLSSPFNRRELIKEADARLQSNNFFQAFLQIIGSDAPADIQRKEWSGLREILSSISQMRARLGTSPSETAMFVFSLKQSLTKHIRLERDLKPEQVFVEMDYLSNILDKLGLFTTEVYQKSREEIIMRQQQEMLELSTPVIKLWDGVIGVPMIGTLDSNRSQIVMEGLLQAIVDYGADTAIIDITGVPMVDTLTAQHLLKAISAARLMGAECIISGIRPQIAQTIVHLGIELNRILTKATLADALALALKHRGLTVRPIQESMMR